MKEESKIEEIEYQRVDSNAVILWTINGLIESVIVIIIAWIIGKFIGDTWKYILNIIVGISFVWNVFISPSLEYKQWKFKIGEKRIDIIKGIYFKTHSIIPISKIQYLKIVQGVFQKASNLATIEILTAGNSAEISNISKKDAEKMIEYLNEYMEKGEKLDEIDI